VHLVHALSIYIRQMTAVSAIRNHSAISKEDATTFLTKLAASVSVWANGDSIQGK